MPILLGLPRDHRQKVVFSDSFFLFLLFLNKGYYTLMAMCQAVPARSACLPGKPTWAPREWSWLEAPRHSSVQVKASPPGNSLINCSHHHAAVQKCKVIIIARWPAELPTAELRNEARTSRECVPARTCPHPGGQAIPLLCPGQTPLTRGVFSLPGLRGRRSTRPRAGLQHRGAEA